MNLYVIHTGNFKLDGGAMFGVVPKVLWQKTNPADEYNLCTWAMRCLLVETSDRLILIDCGIGDKQSEKFFSHYYLHGDHTLQSSLYKAGFGMDQITDVFLTHLHFDHCGGALIRSGKDIVPAFPNAKYWTHREHWEWANAPNAREKASFLTENIQPLEEIGHLNLLDSNDLNCSEFEFITVDGHTEKQMLPIINYQGQTIVFVADLLPSRGHIPLPYVMGYDIRPLVTLKEKAEFLNRAVEEKYILFFEHDPQVECCTLKHTEKGVRLDRHFPLKEIL